MRKFLIASHGRVASGIKSAVNILTHDDSAITAVDCYLDESDFTPQIQEFLDSLQEGDEAVIFTDLLGGSVCNKVTQMHPERYGAIHVTGVNLITVLGCLLSDEPLTPEVVDGVVETGASLIQRVAVDEGETDDGSEGDFFA
jgi:PTS system mannose-specific IIA component